MSCYMIYYKGGAKMMNPVLSREEYLAIRNGGEQRDRVKRIRAGEEELKTKLVQMNYSCLPNEDGTLKGTTRMSTTVGMDVDHIKPEEMLAVRDRILQKKDELGLLMLEESARGAGYHLVFKRRADLDQEGNLKWASELLEVAYDAQAKDFTRVFFTTTAAQLLFLKDDIFEVQEFQSVQEAKSLECKVESEELRVKSEELRVKSEESTINNEKLSIVNSVSGERLAVSESDLSLQPLDISHQPSQLSSSLPYDRIVPAIFMSCCPSYPNVPEGIRNDTLFTVSKMLRYICDFDEAKMKALLYPQYSYGLSEAEVDKTIRSALMRERGLMPRELKQILRREGVGGEKCPEEETEENQVNNPYHIYPALSSCVLDDLSMPKLPRWVETLLKVVQPGYRFITIAGCSTAMMTLLTDVKKKYGSKQPARLNGWTHWDGLSGSGKRQLKMVIDQLHKHIAKEDEKRRAMVNEIVAYNRTAKDGEKKPLPPLLQRLLECDTTRKAHIQQMDELKGKKTYTFAEELSSLNLKQRGYNYRADFCRLLFENGGVGSMNAMDDSYKLKTPCNWDVTTTSTHDQTIAQWAKEVQNGAAQRVFFCMVPDNTWQRKPTEVQWTEEEVAYLDRATGMMMKLSGLVRTPKLDEAIDEWVENIRQTLMEAPEGKRNVERARFRFRSSEIAHTLGVVMHCCFIVQKILDREDKLIAVVEEARKKLEEMKGDINASCESVAEAERSVIAAQNDLEMWKKEALDLSKYAEEKASVELAVFAADYCLETQDMLWGKRLRAQITATCGTLERESGRSKSDEDYERLPTRFSMEDLVQMNWKSEDALKKMISRFQKTNLVRKVATESRKAIYEKNVA